MKEQYNKEGFKLFKGVFTRGFCEELKQYNETLPPKVMIPGTNIPWGWGNLLGKGPYKKISECKEINNFCKQILGEGYVFNHLFVHNKVPWCGLREDFHQEVFNISTFAPGYSPKNDWHKFMQIYIPLDDQNLENGGLKIIPGTPQEGILNHLDILGPNLGHKRRVTNDDLDRVFKKYGIVNCELNAGDVLCFNHLLVHGSTSNHSPYPRRAIVLQARKDDIPKDENVLKQETKYRTNFVIKMIKNRLETLEKKDIYKDSNLEIHEKVDK
tara:strand:- start:13307 stop:14116 length:810 start_codon:yes stop_codon:yes gene_type:complete